MIIFTNIKAVAALQFFFSVSSLSFSLSKLLHILLQNDSMRVDNPQIFYLNKIGGRKKNRERQQHQQKRCALYSSFQMICFVVLRFPKIGFYLNPYNNAYFLIKTFHQCIHTTTKTIRARARAPIPATLYGIVQDERRKKQR